MSHNIRLSGVRFTDLVSLGSVVAEVSKGLATLDQNAKTFRTYMGESNVCDACIKLPGLYDIGLTRHAEGYYEPLLESALMHRETPVGVYGAPLGLVQQEYAAREAEYQAAQLGYATERVAAAGGKVVVRIQVPD